MIKKIFKAAMAPIKKPVAAPTESTQGTSSVSYSNLKRQRIRDPIHDLIIFEENSEADQLAWDLLNTREFQRMRRIKQLGFSDFVFPGASHTRLAHSMGVFNNARHLLRIIKPKIGNNFDEQKALVTSCAALLHDVGHGPFSHTFEGVQKNIGNGRKHEIWTGDIILGDTEVHAVLDKYDSKLAENVANLLKQENPKDIYDAVVSSQFDADRLDYLCRDRYMTGTNSGIFDVNWLLDCLEVGQITIEDATSKDFYQVSGLYINHKGIQAAESYLLARYHLYSQVYLHKTTRAAEQMLQALLTPVAKLITENRFQECGLAASHPLVKFYQESPSVENYLKLDDTVITSAINELTNAKNAFIAELATRLLNRKLYKCFDVTSQGGRGNAIEDFRYALTTEMRDQLGTLVLTDKASLSAYSAYDYEDRKALQKVLVGRPDGSGKTEDIINYSPIIKAIDKKPILRIYTADSTILESIHALWERATS